MLKRVPWQRGLLPAVVLALSGAALAQEPSPACKQYYEDARQLVDQLKKDARGFDDLGRLYDSRLVESLLKTYRDGPGAIEGQACEGEDRARVVRWCRGAVIGLLSEMVDASAREAGSPAAQEKADKALPNFESAAANQLRAALIEFIGAVDEQLKAPESSQHRDRTLRYRLWLYDLSARTFKAGDKEAIAALQGRLDALKDDAADPDTRDERAAVEEAIKSIQKRDAA